MTEGGRTLLVLAPLTVRAWTRCPGPHQSRLLLTIGCRVGVLRALDLTCANE